MALQLCLKGMSDFPRGQICKRKGMALGEKRDYPHRTNRLFFFQLLAAADINKPHFLKALRISSSVASHLGRTQD